jgi:predicted ATP-dependent serine protease
VGAAELAGALARIEGRFGAHALARGDAAERRRGELVIATDTSLDRVIAGRLAAGEPIAFIGPPTVGKLTLALRAAAGAQAQGGMVAWVDPTASFDPLAAERAGVDLERIVLIRTREVALATASALRSEGFRLVVVDAGEPGLGAIDLDELAPALPAVRGSPAALLVVAGKRGSRIAIPTFFFDRLGWELRFGRTVGWFFAVGRAHASDRALFSVATDGGFVDLGARADLAEVAV